MPELPYAIGGGENGAGKGASMPADQVAAGEYSIVDESVQGCEEWGVALGGRVVISGIDSLEFAQDVCDMLNKVED